MTNYELIRQAIQQKLHVIADFKGHRREMCPHAIGTKNGRRQALFYQYGGGSSSRKIVAGSRDNWRCIPVDELANIELREGDWLTADNHSQPQTCVGIVDVRVVI